MTMRKVCDELGLKFGRFEEDLRKMPRQY